MCYLFVYWTYLVIINKKKYIISLFKVSVVVFVERRGLWQLTRKEEEEGKATSLSLQHCTVRVCMAYYYVLLFYCSFFRATCLWIQLNGRRERSFGRNREWGERRRKRKEERVPLWDWKERGPLCLLMKSLYYCTSTTRSQRHVRTRGGYGRRRRW